MKVLVISHSYVERDNHKKLESLSRLSGVEVGVVYPRVWRTWHNEIKSRPTPAPPASRVDQKSYEEFPVGTFFAGNGGKYFYNPLGLLKILLKFRPDLIHLEEEPFTPAAFEAALFSRWLRIKVLFFSWENIDLFLGPIRSVLEKFTFSVSTAAIAGNLGAKDRLKSRGFKGNIRTIPQFGVDLELFRKTDFPGTTKEGFVVGFVGRPSLAKGIDTLFEAVSLAGPQFRLLIVTSSPKIPEEVLNLARAAGVWARTKFEVLVPHSKLPNFYNLMDVFVLPSRTTKTWVEQFGRTMIEAMACSLPVIGSSSGAIPEVIGKAGIVFPEGDSQALSSHLVKIANDQDLRLSLGQMGRELVKERYTFDQIARETVDFYRNL